MKTLKSILSLVLITTLFLTSCSSDDNNNDATPTNSLVGTWTFEKEEALDANDKVVSTYIPNSYQFCEKEIYEFLVTGQYIITQYEYYFETCNLDLTEGTWEQNGNEINIKSGDFSNQAVIKFVDDLVYIDHAPLTGDDAVEYDPSVTKIRIVLKKK
ncbi:hypothetical protein K5I29_10990 [Flavobacterium agricola]|uniref:Lipocalin-like domain-containing protein n=1 Tax=Flavobacterium agricola TaxID=2870839 RepID=A0ABY6LXE2_9FLAO|nr:lipocalin family protein [Flavobacterium agricola]UYW01008.1 hypothetical protein K5I29_10990 [Flavobacterium agricola]